jgi:adenylate kinase
MIEILYKCCIFFLVGCVPAVPLLFILIQQNRDITQLMRDLGKVEELKKHKRECRVLAFASSAAILFCITVIVTYNIK